MKIVIVGGGVIGQYIVAELENEGHDIVLIDLKEDNVEKISASYDVMAISGDGVDVEVLKEADVENADILIAVTSEDEKNILCALSGKKLGAKNTIARIRDPKYAGQLALLKNELGLSMWINPELAFAEEVVRLIKFPSALNVEAFAKDNVEMVEIKIEKDNKLCGLSLIEMSSRDKLSVLVCAAVRGEEVIIPRGTFVIEEGDRLFVTASKHDMHVFAKRYGLIKQRAKKVMIIGGEIDSFYLAKGLVDAGINVKIIVDEYDKATYFADNALGASVSLGELTDTDLLIEEGIDEVDTVICLTGSDDKNTMLSLFVKNRNPETKIIARADANSVKVLMEKLGEINVMSPKTVAADIITSYVRAKNNAEGSRVITLSKLIDGKLEALEFVAERGSKILATPLSKMQFKPNVLIGAIVRKNQIITPNGDTVIMQGDSIIVVTTNSKFDSLEDILA